MKTNLIIIFTTAITLMLPHIKANVNCHKPHPAISTETCCSLPNFYTEEIKEKCGSIENEFKMDNGRDHQCFVSCALEETGIFTDGKFMEEILNTYLSTALEDTPDIIETIGDAFKHCVPSYEIVGRTIKSKGPCALYHVLIMDCVFMKTFKNCTDSVWSNSEECNVVRDMWQKCLPNNF
ncbi:hypothetical protein FF38_02646 [Lucilia cuprina]|uniref:Uncharacterized protein n=1 Tax=Lucilia cuprina TaxID=7375 RepID=A0A0L0C4A3_LUCCU|nr:hypothetical protein FF38_02646 [Lucilia cuprina]